VENHPVPGIFIDISYNYSGEPWTNWSHLECLSPAYSHVLMSWKFSLSGYMFIIHCDTKNAAQLTGQRQGDIPLWMYDTFFSFAISVTTECFVLATMTYDRYIAICKPLLYPVSMTNRFCIWLLVLSFLGGFLHAVIHECFSVRLTYCKSNIIYHFFCDIIPLLKISCTDPSINFLMLFIFSGSIQVFTILTVLTSYSFVLFTILKKRSIKSIKPSPLVGPISYLCLCTMGLFSSCMCALHLHKQMIKIWWTLCFILS
jgi:hypothetical protein